MQGNHNEHKETSLVDRGWTMMNAQLDEVMPVRKRRGFPWFFLLLFLVFSSSAAIFNDYFTKEKDENISKIIPSTPIAENLEKTSSPQITEPVSMDGQVQENENTNTGGIPIGGYIGKKINNKISSPGFESEKNVNNKPSISKQPTIRYNEKEEQSSQPVLVTKKLDKQVTNTLKMTTADLLVNNISLLTYKVQALEKEIIAKPLKTLRLLASIESEVGLSGSPQGLAFGIGLQKKISKKWSLELGVNYQYVSSNLVSKTLGLEGNRSAEVFEPITNIYGSPTYSLNQTFDRLNIEKINLPLQLRLKFGNRWNALAGIQASFYKKAIVLLDTGLSSGAISEPELLDDNKFDLYNSSFSVYSLDSNTNAASLPFDLVPNRWQFSTFVGLQYQFAKHFELDGRYKTNVSNWPDKTQNYGDDSFLSVGLRYYLK